MFFLLSVLQDVLELLEKRVKSRFSHRQIHLLSRLTLPQYLQRFQTQLRLRPEDVPDQHFTQEWNAELEVREGGKMKSQLPIVTTIFFFFIVIIISSSCRFCARTSRFRMSCRNTSTPAQTSAPCRLCW